MPLPRARLAGCSCRSPLTHFFIHHSDSSLRELHPFTTITHLASEHAATPAAEDYIWIQFLFRKRSRGKPEQPSEKAAGKPSFDLSRLFRTKQQRMQSVQWTERLAGLVDEKQGAPPGSWHGSEADPLHDDVERQSRAPTPPRPSTPAPHIRIALRLEGPYFAPADPARYAVTVCLVAGTGISGALAVASAFAASRRRRRSNAADASAEPKWRRCVVAWSVRAADAIELPFPAALAGTELRTHRTGPGRPRLDVAATLADVRAEEGPGAPVWVYISGPKAFVEAGKEVCKGMPDVDFYAASWDV